MAKRKPARVTTEGKPWGRYLRLSKAEIQETRGLKLSKEQRLELTNQKLDDHLEELTEWLQEQGLPYDDDLIFRDAALSASDPKVVRPDWDRMMALARAGELAGVGIVAMDRFTRDITTMEDLIKLADTTDVLIGGPRAGTVDLTTYEGKMQARGAANQAAGESLATSHRIKEKLLKQARKGKPMMGPGRAYGFEVVGDKFTIEIPQVPQEVAVIREVARRLLEGEALDHLAEDLNARGILTVLGNPWRGTNLGQMLSRPYYGGRVVRDEVELGVMPGEPILDAETYAGVKALLDSRRHGAKPNPLYLLTGILECTRCERTMNGGRVYKPGKSQRPRIYKCPSQSGGCSRSINAEQIEAVVAMRVAGLMANDENRARIEAGRSARSAATQAAHDLVRTIKAQLVKLEVKWASDSLEPEAYDEAKRTLDRRLAKARTAVEELPPVDLVTLTPEDGESEEGRARLAEATAEWHAMGSDRQRHIIRAYRLRPAVTAPRPGAGNRFDPKRLVWL